MDECAVQGFAYAGPYRTRPAYRYTVEDSVYVAPGAHGRGVGRALLGRLIALAEARNLRQMVAIIGDSANHASIGLHAGPGFRAHGGASLGRLQAWPLGRQRGDAARAGGRRRRLALILSKLLRAVPAYDTLTG